MSEGIDSINEWMVGYSERYVFQFLHYNCIPSILIYFGSETEREKRIERMMDELHPQPQHSTANKN